MLRLVAVTVGLVLLSCLLPSGVRAADPFEINVILPMTGPSSFAGRELHAALDGVEAYVNKTGGIRGRAIKFVYEDDQTNPQIDVQLINGLTAKGVPLILGPDLTAPCAAVAPLGQKSGPVMYCFSNGVHPAAGSYMFSASPSTVDLLRAAVRYFRDRGWSKIGVIASTDATGQDGEASLAAALSLPENRSVTVVAREHFNPTDLTVAAQIASLKGSGAQVLVAWTTGTPLATLLRGANDGALDLPILTSSGNAIPAQIQQYSGFLPKDFIIAGVGSMAPDLVSDPAQRAAIAAYNGAMVTLGAKPSFMKTAAWDPALLIVSAYKALGFAATAEQFRTYLAGVKGFTGVDGTYDFRSVPQRGLTLENVYMLRWDAAKGDWSGISGAGGAARR